MPNGLLGLNVRTLGVSRDQVLSAVRQLGCAWVLVQDDPELIQPLKAMGVKTIYRQSGDENLSLDPAQFVQTRAEKGADYVYLSNELDPTPEVLAYTMECMKYADKIGVKCVVGNYATDRSAAQWQAATEVARYAASHGHANGLHVYLLDAGTHPASFAWLPLKHAIGGLWLVTEYAFYRDAYHGYRGLLSPAQYGTFLDNTLGLFRDEQMPVALFSGDPWPLSDEGKRSGFGVLDNAAMLTEITRVNAKYKWTGITVTPTQPKIEPPTTGGVDLLITGFPPTITYRNIRTQPTPNAQDLGDLALHDVVTAYLESPSDGWIYLERHGDTIVPTVKGWVLWKGIESKPYGTQPPAAFTLQYPVTLPVRISQSFGVNLTGIPDFYTRWGLPAHEGVDFGGREGDPIYAAADGMIKAINIPGKGGVVADHAYGIHLKVTHTGADGKAYETDYCHLSKIVAPLTVRQVVKAGQQIGFMGHTGDANNQVHLHWMCRKAGNTAAGVKQKLGDGTFALYINDIVNPEDYLK